MADHGLTGTHHLDGTLCTRTASCPWSMVAWTAANATLSAQITAALGATPSPTPMQAGLLQVLASGPWCGCCQRVVDTPYHHDNHNPPYDGYDYCQGCYDWGCGDPNDTCSFPTSPTASPGGHMSTNPISPDHVRDTWPDHPDLTKSQKQILESLTDQQVDDAISEAMLAEGRDAIWENLLDTVTTSVTSKLLYLVPSADSAPEGTDDECTNCGLPISRKDGAWVDAFMGSSDCSANKDEGTHSPKAVLTAYMKALKKGQKIAPTGTGKASATAVSGGGPMLIVVTTDGGAREDGNVYYCGYLLVNEPETMRSAVNAALVKILPGSKLTDGGSNVSITAGANTTADELFDDTADIAAELIKLGFDAMPINTSFLVQNR